MRIVTIALGVLAVIAIALIGLGAMAFNLVTNGQCWPDKEV